MTRRHHALIDPFALSGIQLRKQKVSLEGAKEFVDVYLHNLSPGKESLHPSGLKDWSAPDFWEEKTAPTTLAAGVSVKVNIPEDWAQLLRLWINDQSVQASGTATLVSVTDGDTITINGLVYTAVTGTKADYTEFSVDGADGIVALDLAHSINHDTRSPVTVPTIDVYATVSTNVVTITADDAGVAGNSIDLAETGTTITVSGANLTGGTDVDDPSRYHAYVNIIG